MALIVNLVRFALVAYLAVFAGMFALQRKLLYHTDAVRTAPAAAGLKTIEEIELATPDGERLVAWYGRARVGQPTILYLHGQAGTLATRSARVERYQNAGLGIFMLAWRGYGGSSGAPTEAHNVADAALAYDWLRRDGLADRDIFIYGESLGTGVAVQLATRKSAAAGVILDAPYTSVVDVAAERYPWIPVRLALLDTYRSDLFIRDVHIPVLIMHGQRDRIIPARYGRRLYELASEPKRLALFPEGNHSDLYLHGALETVQSFMAETQIKAAAAPTTATAGH